MAEPLAEAAARGTSVDTHLAAARMAFSLYDADGDGFISREEMARYMASVFRVVAGDEQEGGEERALAAGRRAADRCFLEADDNADGQLSFQEFADWYGKNFSGAGAASTPMPPGPPGEGEADTFFVSVPRATYCYFHSLSRVGARVYRSADSLAEDVKERHSETFVAYVISFQDGDESWSVLRRYSSLKAFVDELRRERVVRTALSVRFPGRKVFGAVDVERRRQELQAYLQELLREPATRADPFVVDFLRTSDAEPADGSEARRGPDLQSQLALMDERIAETSDKLTQARTREVVDPETGVAVDAAGLPLSSLRISLVAGRDLPAGCAPYAVLSVEPREACAQQRISQVARDSQAPRWDEEFELTGVTSKTARLVIAVMDRAGSGSGSGGAESDARLGVVEVPLRELADQDEHERWLPLPVSLAAAREQQFHAFARIQVRLLFSYSTTVKLQERLQELRREKAAMVEESVVRRASMGAR